MTCITAEEEPCVAVGETVNGAFSFDGRLAPGETISTVAPPVEIGTSDLTITGETPSTEEMEISEKDIPAGRAIVYTLTGVTGNKTYRVRFTITSSAGQVRSGIAKIIGVVNT